MDKQTIDGIIDGKNVKVIIKKGKKYQWFAKSKNKDIETPHFIEFNKKLEVHQDSTDNTRYRTPEEIYFLDSKMLPPGITTLPVTSSNALVAVPMISEYGFHITNISGQACIFSRNSSWFLIADVKWSSWKNKRDL